MANWVAEYAKEVWWPWLKNVSFFYIIVELAKDRALAWANKMIDAGITWVGHPLAQVFEWAIDHPLALFLLFVACYCLSVVGYAQYSYLKDRRRDPPSAQPPTGVEDPVAASSIAIRGAARELVVALGSYDDVVDTWSSLQPSEELPNEAKAAYDQAFDRIAAARDNYREAIRDENGFHHTNLQNLESGLYEGGSQPLFWAVAEELETWLAGFRALPGSSPEEHKSRESECPISLRWAEKYGDELTVYLFHEEEAPLENVQVELTKLALVKEDRRYKIDLPVRVILGGGERLFAHHVVEGRRRFEVARRQGDRFRVSGTKMGGGFGHVSREEHGEWHLTYSVTLEGAFCGEEVLRFLWDGSNLRAVEPENT